MEISQYLMATTADSVAALTEEQAFPGKIIRECRADGCRREEGKAEDGQEEAGGSRSGWRGVGVIIKKNVKNLVSAGTGGSSKTKQQIYRERKRERKEGGRRR